MGIFTSALHCIGIRIGVCIGIRISSFAHPSGIGTVAATNFDDEVGCMNEKLSLQEPPVGQLNLPRTDVSIQIQRTTCLRMHSGDDYFW